MESQLILVTIAGPKERNDRGGEANGCEQAKRNEQDGNHGGCFVLTNRDKNSEPDGLAYRKQGVKSDGK